MTLVLQRKGFFTLLELANWTWEKKSSRQLWKMKVFWYWSQSFLLVMFCSYNKSLSWRKRWSYFRNLALAKPKLSTWKRNAVLVFLDVSMWSIQNMDRKFKQGKILKYCTRHATSSVSSKIFNTILVIKTLQILCKKKCLKVNQKMFFFFLKCSIKIVQKPLLHVLLQQETEVIFSFAYFCIKLGAFCKVFFKFPSQKGPQIFTHKNSCMPKP